ncbi:Protein adenylyltransferase SelO [Camellia lanceoleosa]|uniref:Protein adenylyltransferase SelO n=1 Tax=Camellia lanceoleosa TaxID=1840588 RepID=A0ACC0IWZ1_9ERIC|nr:Protein adenylyltransferase SelO [Camellia lanceoleosa]
MQSLGIPTTRALCLVATGKYVTRDMFYDGNPKDEPGAIVYRVAQSFLRFGSYQIHASRGKEDLDIVRTLADYIIRHHFPHIENMSKSESLSFNTGMEDDSVVINLVVWDKHSSFVGTIGLLICMMGGVMYQQSISNKSKAVKEVRFQESEQEQLEIFISLLPYLEVLLLPVTRLCCTFMLL